MSKTYTVCAAFYAADYQATVTVEASSYAEACEKAVAKVDNGEVETDLVTWDCGPTFVHGVVEGDERDPWNGMANVPFEFRDPLELTEEEEAAPVMLAALKAALAYEAEAFETDDSQDGDVNGGDLVEFFAEWRATAKAAVTQAEGGSLGAEPEPAPASLEAAPEVVQALREAVELIGFHFPERFNDAERMKASDTRMSRLLQVVLSEMEGRS